MDEKIDELEPTRKAPQFIKDNVKQSLDLIRTIGDVTEIFTVGFFSTLFDLAPPSKKDNITEQHSDTQKKT